MIQAEIVSIGDELLIGQVVNTNASWMADALHQAGIEVGHIAAISDTKESIIQALKAASSRANIVLITGGLGPTNDDITKEVLTQYFDGELYFHEPSFRQIERLFGSRNIPITPVNRAQAEIPTSCTPIHNAHGTAPGMWFEKDGTDYFSMPGVPFEMRAMIQEQIIPRILEKHQVGSILHKTILTHGVGESYLAELINEWESSLPTHINLAYLPQPGIVRLRLSGKGSSKDTLEEEIQHYSQRLHDLIPHLIFGYGTESMEEVVGKLLKSKGKSLSTAESCTGGYIAHLLSSMAGSSSFYKGSVVSYADDVKTNSLGVAKELIEEHGAVSQQVVESMALGAQKSLNSDYAIATSGIAGPDGGSPEKPVGTVWIAMAGPDGVQSELLKLGEHRGRNIRRSALAALNMLRLKLTV